MLGLLASTDPSWVDAVEGDLDRMLQDHAHCELKAAQSALSLVARFGGDSPGLIEPLVALAREETEHFAEVERRMRERGGAMSVPEPDRYVTGLQKASREGAGARPLLFDRLLVSALIEARSCERFKLLASRLADASLRAFYADLMASEARHFQLFARLARERFGEQETRSRLQILAEREASLVASLPLGPTVHG